MKRRSEPLPAPPAEKSIKIFVDGKLFYSKKLYPLHIESRTSAVESVNHIFENIIGKTWNDRGGKQTKIDFCGGPLTYDEWRAWQAQKTKINFFNVTAELFNEDGGKMDSVFLV